MGFGFTPSALPTYTPPPRYTAPPPPAYTPPPLSPFPAQPTSTPPTSTSSPVPGSSPGGPQGSSGTVLPPPAAPATTNPLSGLFGGLSSLYQGGKDFVSKVFNSSLPLVGNTDFGEAAHNLITGDQSYPGAGFMQNKNLPEGSFTPEYAGMPGFDESGAAAPKNALTLGDIGFAARQLTGDPISYMQRIENTLFPDGNYASSEPAPGAMQEGTFGGSAQLFAPNQVPNYPLGSNNAAMEQGYATVLNKIKAGESLTPDDQWAVDMIEERLAEQGMTLEDIQPQQQTPSLVPPEPVSTAEEVGRAWTQRKNPLRGLGGIYG